MNPLQVEILNYLEKHPQASDTAVGVACWWLSLKRGEMEEVVKDVREALEGLANLGVIERRSLVDGTVLYGNKLRQ